MLAEKIRRFLLNVPRVETADRKVSVREKVMYTVISLLIYLVCRQLPLYGMPAVKCVDPLYPVNSFFHVVVSTCGTVMDLAILPFVMSRIFSLRWVDSMFVEVDTNAWEDINVSEDRAIVHGSQKLMSMTIGLQFSVMHVRHVLLGFHGNADQFGVGNAILVIFQLWFAGIIVIYLDELLQKGYGFGPGISLFVATNICEDIIWKAFYQQNHHNVTNLLATVLIFLIVIYLQGFHVLLPLKSRNESGQRGSYQIKLFYAPNMPIVFLCCAGFNFYIISQQLHASFSGNFFVDLLGKWKMSEHGGGQSIPVGGIAYYITAPSSLADMAANPFRALFYLVFVTSTCALFSKAWVEISGSSAADVAFELKEQEMVVSERPGLHVYIPTAAAFGGICIVALSVLADLIGAFGSGSGILFVVTVISQYFETFEKDEEIELVSLAPLGF